MSFMNWLLILLLSIFGVVMGFLSIKGYTGKIEPFLWLLLGIISALILSKNVNNRLFIHALVIGLFWGILNAIIQSGFFDQYLANNTNLQERFKNTGSIKPQYFVLIMGPLIGLVTGVVLGGLSILLKKLW